MLERKAAVVAGSASGAGPGITWARATIERVASLAPYLGLDAASVRTRADLAINRGSIAP
ncbi:MAG: hypothetical protein ACLPKB_03785 [Xanthobacteraceae bacterium]